MKIWHCLWLMSAACGTSGGDDTIDPPHELSALERCVVDGGSLRELWSVGNQHGPVTSIVAGSLVVLGGADGSVKQWTVDGDEPNYGTPFTTAGATVAAMALSTEHIVAATQDGKLAEWKLADASPARTNTFADVVPSALAISEDGASAIVGTTTGQSYVVDRASGAGTPLHTTLWGVAAVNVAAGNRLYTSGHFYGTPQIERRAADAPIDVVDAWNDERSGHVLSVALDREASHLVAGGDGFVATFAADQLAAGPVAITEAEGHNAVGAVLLASGALFVTAGSEGSLRVWNVETAAPLATLTIPAAIGIAANREGTRLYTSGADGRLHAFGCQ